MNRNFIKIILALSFLFLTVAMVFAAKKQQPHLLGEKEQIQGRMNQRLSIISEWKDQGVLGEKSDGTLEFVDHSKEGEMIEFQGKKITLGELVNDENQDRSRAFQMIVDETPGATIESVGKQRADKVYGQEPVGHFIEINGEWVKK